MTNGTVVTGSFDDLRAHDVRFLQEAARTGPVRVLLWTDEAALALNGQLPRFSAAERRYLVEALHHVDRLTMLDCRTPHELSAALRGEGDSGALLAIDATGSSPLLAAISDSRGIAVRAVPAEVTATIPDTAGEPPPPATGRKRVIVTGCYDWLHSGHVRFFEEVSQLGDLFVVVGHDANVRLLKGAGHPLFPATTRRFMAGAIRYVTRALISSGDGWMDAAPEIDMIRPDIYAVNEDGDKPEKRQFCRERGLEYVVLRRTPRPGLPRRASSDLRGF
jgi:cytidyltransferase-like protein